MAIKFTIGGVDRTSLVRVESLGIQDKLNSRNTAKFQLVSTDGSYRPTIGAEVVVTNMALTTPSDVVTTFTRNSVAWMFGVSYPVNTARYPSNNGTRGVMVEEGTTQRILSSSDLSVRGSIGAVTVTLNADGIADLATVAPGDEGSAYFVKQGFNAASGAVTVSLDVKAAGATTIQIGLYDTVAGAYLGGLVTKTLPTGNYGIISHTGTAIAGRLIDVYVWFKQGGTLVKSIQVEDKAYPTSHIITTGSAATRQPETLTVPTQGLLTPQAGTVSIKFWAAGPLASGTTNHVLFDSGVTAGLNRLILYKVGGGFRALMITGAGATVTATWAGSVTTGFHYASLVYSAARLSLYLDEVEAAFVATPGILTALGTLGYIGSDMTGASQANQAIPLAIFHDRALSGAEVAATHAGSPPSDFTLRVDYTSGAPVLTKGGRAIFGGFVDDYEEEQLSGSDALEIDLDLVDYNAIADQRRVAKAYEVPGQTLSDVVNDIVAEFLDGEGITTTNVQTGPIIEKAIWNYQTVAEAFNDLADLTGYIWYIDYNRDLHFVSRDTNAAPFGLTDSSGNFRKMRVRRTREQYRNRQIIRAGTDLTDPRTETFKGDGETRVWPLAFPVGAVPTAITVNGTPKTLGIGGVDTGKDFYWNKCEAQIKQDDSGTKLTASDVGTITYQGEYPLMLTAQDDGQVAERKAIEGGTGIHEHLEDFPNVNSQAQAEQGAQGLLQKFGRIPRIVIFETDDDGLAGGQLLPVTNTAHDLSGSFLIESVEFGDFGSADEKLRYRVKALDGANLGGWEEFFRALARMGRRFVIRENEVVVTLRQLSETITVSDSVTYTSAAPESRADYALADFSEAAP